MFLAFVICWTKYLSTVKTTSRVIVKPAIESNCQIDCPVEAPVGKNMKPTIKIIYEKVYNTYPTTRGTPAVRYTPPLADILF